MDKRLVSGSYKAVKIDNTVTLYGSTQVRCIDWTVKFEQTADRVSPPIHEFYLHTGPNCLEIPGELKDSVGLQIPEDENWDHLIVKDASGEQTVPIVDAGSILISDEVIWVAGGDQCKVIAEVGTEYEECQVIPANFGFIGTHRVVFGPDTLEACTLWQYSNCSAGTKI